jgi:multicomponent Na+:H+ antiporter subunit D
VIDRLMPLAVLLTSLVPGIAIFFLAEESRRARTAWNLGGAALKLVLVAVMLRGVAAGRVYELRVPLLPTGTDLLLRADPPALLFMVLSAVLWLFTTVYAIAYLEHAVRRSRFFAFFSLCVSATMGVALAGDLITFFIFYELLTLVTYPLVVHRGTPAALAAGRTYLRYTVFGGALLLVAVIWLHVVAGPVEFTERGALAGLGPEIRPALRAIFFVAVAGLGVKAAIVPLHGWLPRAMIAPAPVSALLHAVAVVKAGAFGIIRLVYDVYGIEFSGRLGVTTPLAIAAAVTIVYGSVRALAQDDLKRRLAYSTVSQVSYIVLGTAIVGYDSLVGGLVHLVHQGLQKITLFFCAGNLAETIGVREVSRMGGVGRRMPWTMAAFTVGALGMIGLPPLAGFVTKWYLGTGALEAGAPWSIGVLVVSGILNAAYFLPVLRRAWLDPPAPGVQVPPRTGRLETSPGLLWPTLATALLALAVGVLAGAPLSPLSWARLIIDREYAP